MVFATGGGQGEQKRSEAADGEGGTKWCLDCGSEWVDQLDECPDCDAPLVSDNPFVSLPAPSEDHAHIEYELDEWSVESRVMLDQLLGGAKIPHVWEGARLVVPEDVEDATDEFVEQVELATLPTLDPDADLAGFTLDEWEDEKVEALTAQLDEAGIAWEIDADGDLVVAEADADAVEAMLDAVDHPDALPVDGEGDLAVTDDEKVDIDPDVVLGGLFVACDRLVHDAKDHQGVLAVAEQAATLEMARLPYGFPVGVWKQVREEAATLLGLLESETSTDDEVGEQAEALRAVLRPYI